MPIAGYEDSLKFLLLLLNSLHSNYHSTGRKNIYIYIYSQEGGGEDNNSPYNSLVKVISNLCYLEKF